MSRYSAKTIHLDLIENARTKSEPYIPLQYSTLNEYWDHFSDEPRPSGYPTIGYMAIGNGGHAHATGNVGAALLDDRVHEVTDARLFNHIPFIVRPRGADLSATERAKYRIRRLETHAGQEYWVYYLKKITFTTSTPTIEVITTVNNVTTSVPFEATGAMLNPTPLPMVNGQVQGVTGRKISVQSPLSITLTNAEIREIINACEILFGDARYAIISEIALVSGYDKVLEVNTGGVPISYTELICAQCCNFLGDRLFLSPEMRIATFSYELGNIQTYRR